MSDKSYVGMGHHICPVCGEKHDEVVLLDKRLRESLTKDEFMGYELCLIHSENSDEYLYMIVVDNDQFTGDNIQIRREAFKHLFNTSVKQEQKFVFTEPEVLKRLQKMNDAIKEY
jgi:hypothetical protein